MSYVRRKRSICGRGFIILNVQQIVDGVHIASREYPLRKVELFGSYASGKNMPRSRLAKAGTPQLCCRDALSLALFYIMSHNLRDE